MLNVLIVEDELRAQKLLLSLLSELIPDLRVIGTANSPEEALAIVKEHPIDLVFLDIELENGSGFDFLDQLEECPFKIIFTTAYDHFALKAIKHDAIDYLLKPYSPGELIHAVNKAKARQHSESWLKDIKRVLSTPLRTAPSKLALKTSTGIHLININDIVRIEADGSYSKIYQLNQEKCLMVSQTIGKIEQQLNEHPFFRVHAAHLVHLHYVQSYLNEDGGYVLLTNLDKIPVSRRKKASFIDTLMHYHG